MRQASILASIILCLSLLIRSNSEAAEFNVTPSLQGFSGLFNTPNAMVTPEGSMDAAYTDQIEEKWRSRTNRQENYIFSIGLFSVLEIGGRLTEAPGVARDLSGNAKLTSAPFFADSPMVPVIALGIQDFGGGAPFLRTTYVAVTETFGPARLSIGYGHGPDRMKGVFGGGELRLFDWLQLLGEYDTAETNIGFKLLSPEIPLIPFTMQATLKTSLEHHTDRPEFAISMRLPLGSRHHAVAPIKPETGLSTDPPPAITPVEVSAAIATTPQSVKASGNRLTALRQRLIDDGFLNVRVGSIGNELLVVEYENSRFNHNELDAMGQVLGGIVSCGNPVENKIRLVMIKRGIRTLMLEAPSGSWLALFNERTGIERLSSSLLVSSEIPADSSIIWEQTEPANIGRLKAEAVLYPAVKTFVGTEVGVFDYYLSLKTDSFLPLWTGATLNARINTPIAWSENLDDGKIYQSYRDDQSFERLMLFQAVKPAADLWLSLSGGMILERLYGTLNEAVWNPGGGSHRFRIKQMYAEDDSSKEKKEVYLASYRFRYSPLDLSLETTVGKFYDQDKGFSAELKRYFGDTSFSVYYKNSKTVSDERIQAGGVTFTFPLTPRRDMPSYPLRIRGSDEWSYSQETEITSPGKGLNWIGRSIGLNPQLPFNIERVFQNRDRLNEDYIEQNLLRLRDAWLTYGSCR